MRIEEETTRYIVVEAGDTIEDLIGEMQRKNLRKTDAIAFEGRATLFLGDGTHLEGYVSY